MKRPVLTLVAGANGAGKTSVTSLMREFFQQSPLLDPDAFARNIHSESTSETQIEAARKVLRLCEELILSHESFSVETTLSGKSYLRLLTRAQEAGFVVNLIYVGTESVEINAQRIRMRVEKGGHNIPQADQRRRYPRSFANLHKVFADADFCVLLDNSTLQGPTLVASGFKGELKWFEPLPRWAAGLR